jgi:hypothetical protein
MLTDAQAQRIPALGDDVIRFSSQPALGGSGYIVTVVRGGYADVAQFWGHGEFGWTLKRDVRFEISEKDFQRLAKDVDDDLARGDPKDVDDDLARGDPNAGCDGVIVLCSDGPGYLTERARHGAASWVSGFCEENNPNNLIAPRLFNWLGEHGVSLGPFTWPYPPPSSSVH